MFETVKVYIDSEKTLHLKKNNYIRAELSKIIRNTEHKNSSSSIVNKVIKSKQAVIQLLAGWEEEREGREEKQENKSEIKNVPDYDIDSEYDELYDYLI